MVENEHKLGYSVHETAKLLGISRCLCYELVRQKRIPALKLGQRRLIVPRAALERMLEGQTQEQRMNQQVKDN